MKKKKTKLIMGLSVLFIGFLINTSSLNTLSIKALVDEKNNQFYIDSFERSDWKWTTTEVVSTESTNYSFYPSLAVDTSGNVHIAWHDRTNYASSGTDTDIFYKRWNASSSSWTITEVVSTECIDDSEYPSLAVDTSGNVHIAWDDLTDYNAAGTDSDIFYKRWNASTTLWSTTEVVSTESTDDSEYPSLAVDTSGNVHLAWHDYTDYNAAGTDPDIFYKRWEASTSSWTTVEVVSTESTGYSWSPSLVVEYTGTIHIAWYDRTDYNGAGPDWDIFYRRWEASTYSWITTEVVSTESTLVSSEPSLAVDTSGNVHLAWQDVTFYVVVDSDYDIFYKEWEVSTESWTTTEIVSTESTLDSLQPSVSVDTLGDVHIAWIDGTNYTEAGIDWDIFYRRREASTSSWIMTEVVSTESTLDSIYPSLDVDTSGNVHIAWHNYDYNGSVYWDIFYKLLAGPPAAPELAFIVPNPKELNTIYLDWNDVLEATTYYVYRSTSYIWLVEELIPITAVSSSEYIDAVPVEGFYYYVIVAENFAGNSTHSNCQYVEVKFADLEAPELAPLLPNPTDSDSISLEWDSIDGAIEYFIYRSTSYIWSVESLTPIATVGITSYVDTLPSEGYYFYVIVASDGILNSTHSNCEYVEYKVPHLREFSIVSGLIVAAFVLVFVVTRIRKRNFKPN